MKEDNLNLKILFEQKPLFSKINVHRNQFNFTTLQLHEVEFHCDKCAALKPFHNSNSDNLIFEIGISQDFKYCTAIFKCVSCKYEIKGFSFLVKKYDLTTLSITKCGEYPQKQLPKNKQLSKFLKNDRDEYDKAVICLANGYGVAAFAYFRRIVESNINRILDLIIETENPIDELVQEINELRKESPMSKKIEIINKTLPGYLRPPGFNPLGTLYAVLSDGVHSLPEDQCLEKANDICACLEFLIGGLVDHKDNMEKFKSNLSSLKKKP